MKTNLYIFTASFPFSSGETFLANELTVIAPYFEKVKLLPHYNPSGNIKTRPVPVNVEFEKPLLPYNIIIRSLAGLFNFAPLLPHLRDLKNLFRDGNNFKYNIKQWYLSLLSFRCLYSSKRFKVLKKNLRENDILYFYWGLGQASILPYLSHSKTFIRIHGGEIEFERHYGYIPLIKEIIRHSPHIISISELVKNKLLQIFDYKNVFVNRLGVYDHGISPLPFNEDRIRIVSCSNVIPIKRIHLIIKTLSLIKDYTVEWIHFGSGPLMTEIKRQAKNKLNKNITYQFYGRVDNDVILNYYKDNYVDLFVNVSSTEGVPVSIMEAMSFGIPCFATGAGATNELVSNLHGHLVDIDFNIEVLLDAIINVRSSNGKAKRQAIKKHIAMNFDARKNFKRLVKILNN